MNHAVWNLLKGIGAASAIGLVFATALGLVAVRRTLRPLEEMSHEVESIQETDDLSKRLSGRGPRDEVGRLAEGFDRMLGRLQEAFLSQRRFLSDASHELRTPMTVVRGQLELLAMDVESLPGRRSTPRVERPDHRPCDTCTVPTRRLHHPHRRSRIPSA